MWLRVSVCLGARWFDCSRIDTHVWMYMFIGLVAKAQFLQFFFLFFADEVGTVTGGSENDAEDGAHEKFLADDPDLTMGRGGIHRRSSGRLG